MKIAKLGPGKIVGLAGLGVLLGGIIAGNIVCDTYSGVITKALCGNGVSFNGEEVEKDWYGESP